MSRKGMTVIEFLSIFGIIFIIIIFPLLNIIYGVGGFGPQRTVIATVNTKHVDSGENSHYMITTDAGVFEVDNGFMLGVWNSDEIYGSIQDRKKYKFTTKGNKVIGMFFQEYPYIIKCEEIIEPLEKSTKKK